MRVMVLGGTRFLGRRIVELAHERGDEVLVTHRGQTMPEPWVDVPHLLCDRRDLADHAGAVRAFAPDVVVDTIALTAADVDAVLPVVGDVPAVVLSSQDVYAAFDGLRSGRAVSPVPLTEDAELRSVRYPHRGSGVPGVPDDYEKLDVEERWLSRGAVVLRLPMVYGPHDWQRREEPILRRLRAGRSRIPVGPGTLLWTRGHVDDLAAGVLAAIDTRAADGLTVNLGEPATMPISWWLEQVVTAAGADAELVTVPDRVLPAELAITGSFAQHLLVDVGRAGSLLGFSPRVDTAGRIAESVAWHLEHPPSGPALSAQDAAGDDAALAAAVG